MCDNLCENVIDDTGMLKNKDCVSGWEIHLKNQPVLR